MFVGQGFVWWYGSAVVSSEYIPITLSNLVKFRTYGGVNVENDVSMEVYGIGVEHSAYSSMEVRGVSVAHSAC